MKTRRRRSSPMSSSSAASRSGTADSCFAVSSWPSCWCLRSSSWLRRSASIARCFAVAMSQAPGFAGTPCSGHFSRAATRASCARSSARPTSRTIRVSPAINFADSIRQTASMARWVLEAVTASNHTTGAPEFKPDRRFSASAVLNGGWLPFAGDLRGQPLLALPDFGGVSLPEVRRLEHLADLDLRLLARRVRTALHPFDRLVERLHLEEPEAGDELFRFGERAVDDGSIRAREPDARTLRARLQPLAGAPHAGLLRAPVVPRPAL